VTRLWAGWPRVCPISCRCKILSCLQSVQINCGAHPAYYLFSSGGSYPVGGKQPGRWSWPHLPPFSLVKKDWRYAFMTEPNSLVLLVLKPPSWKNPLPVHFTSPHTVLRCYFKKLFTAALKYSKFQQNKVKSVSLVDITAEVKSTCSFKMKSLMFTGFFEVAVIGCYNHMLYCYFQAPVVHLLSYNPTVLAKPWCWILCWATIPFHILTACLSDIPYYYTCG